MTTDLETAIISAVVEGAHANPSRVDVDPKHIAKQAIRQADAVAEELEKGQSLSFTAAAALSRNGERSR